MKTIRIAALAGLAVLAGGLQAGGVFAQPVGPPQPGVAPPPPPPGLLPAVAARPVEEINVVTVEGRGTTNEEALRDALRKAVELGAGQFIHAQSETRNYELVLDKVLSKSAGFVKGYDPNPPVYSPPDADGIIHVKITARVAVKEVATEWGEIQILLEQKGKPRVMVAIAERIDGQKQDDSTVASEVEKLLLKNDFPLVDKGQFTEIQKKDITSAAFEDDIGKVVALGKQFGAELIVTGSSQADFGSTENLYGVTAFMYGTTVKVKAVRTDNAATLFSDNVSTRKGSRTRTGGAHDALRAAGVEIAQKVQDGIVAKWGREVAESQSLNVEISEISFARRNELTTALRKMEKIKGVQERNYANKVAFYTIDYKGLGNDFAKELAALKDWKLEITDVSANTIKAKHTE